jgi:hypothetical protein
MWQVLSRTCRPLRPVGRDIALGAQRLGHALAVIDVHLAAVGLDEQLDMGQDAATETAVNRIIAAAPGAWLYYGYNAEFLFYPFCETRTVGEMLAFHAEERRDAMLTYVVDLYAGDLDAHPSGVAAERAFLDRAGYFALARGGAGRAGGAAARLPWRPALAVRGAHPRRAAADRPDRPVPGQAGSEAAGRPHVLG